MTAIVDWMISVCVFSGPVSPTKRHYICTPAACDSAYSADLSLMLGHGFHAPVMHFCNRRVHQLAQSTGGSLSCGISSVSWTNLVHVSLQTYKRKVYLAITPHMKNKHYVLRIPGFSMLKSALFCREHICQCCHYRSEHIECCNVKEHVDYTYT